MSLQQKTQKNLKLLFLNGFGGENWGNQVESVEPGMPASCMALMPPYLGDGNRGQTTVSLSSGATETKKTVSCPQFRVPNSAILVKKPWSVPNSACDVVAVDSARAEVVQRDRFDEGVLAVDEAAIGEGVAVGGGEAAKKPWSVP